MSDGDNRAGGRELGEGLSTADPVQMALERMQGAGGDDFAQRFLAKQERLAEAQTREARAHVSQLGRERWRDIIISLLGLCVLATGALFVWDATQARGVAIEPFRVPPDVEARGLDGVVVATQVMDQLFAIQNATESIRAPSTYANNWGGDIAVEIPNTGVTIGDLRSSLRAWLGQQVRLSGEVVRMPDGQIALTVRVGADAGERFAAPEAEFDTLVRQAAEAIYRRTQPYRYSIWLRNNGRVDEATEIVSRLANSTNTEDRLWAINTLAARTPDPNESIKLHERGLRIDPDFTPVLYNISNILNALGREEEALRYTSRLIGLEDVARRQINPARVDQVMLSARSANATLRRDMPLACKLAREEMEKATDRGSQILTPLSVAACLIVARDVAGARQFLADAGLGDPESMAERLAETSPSSELESLMAFVLEDWERAYLILKDVLVAEQDPDLPYNLMINQTLAIKTQIAEAAAQMGRVAEAREIMATLPPSCEICDRVSGVIEALAGNAAGARQLFNQAIGDSPNLPATYFDYAQALNILKDWHGAIPQAQKAVALAPKWADPHLSWGDALMGMGEPRAAAGRYREATRLAPKWGAAWLGLGEAHAASGNEKAAREAWETAARLPLSPAGMAKVEQRLRK